MVDVHEDNPLVLPLYCQVVFFLVQSFLNVQNQTGVPMADNPPRLLQGYGANFHDHNGHHPKWRTGPFSVQFVINYEEGGENCLLNGDKQSEWLLSEIVGATPYEGVRHMNMESLYEYGSSVGFWRLHRMFTQRSMPRTVFAVAGALELNPRQVATAMVEADWEIASHGYRWIDYQYMSEEEEREHIRKAVDIHTGLLAVGHWESIRGNPVQTHADW